MSLQTPAITRFLALTTIRPSQCWLWNGSKNKLGYGQFVLDGRRGRRRVRIAPYRFIWEWVNDQSMAEGLEPDHTCNNRECVNPAHIEPVTHAENQRRSALRRKTEGRKINYPVKPRPSHCPRGHEYTPENTVSTPAGSAYCRKCNRIACLAYQERKRQRVNKLIAA